MGNKIDRKLRIEEYPKGIILPRKEVPNGPMWGLGGVCDSDNHFVQSSYYDGGWATHGGEYAWEAETYLDVEAVYIGMFFLHWGHFLVDLTNRMWTLPDFRSKPEKVKVAYLGEEEPGRNHLRFLELLGVEKDQLIHIEKPTRFRKVYVPEQGFKSCAWYSDEYVHMLNIMVQSAMHSGNDFSHLEHIENVYFTRRSFAKAVCTEFGEGYFESVFTHNGYTALAPETLTLDEQIFLWNHAKSIVCMNGTIPLNVMFACNPELNLTVLNKMSIFHENPIILLEMRGIQASFVNIFKEPLKGYPKSLGEGPYLLWPTQEFDEYCEKKQYSRTMSERSRQNYFNIQTVSYYWSVLGIIPKIRMGVSRCVPRKIKAMLRAIK